MTTEGWVFPASFVQQRMWFLAQLEPDSSFYNIPTAMRMKGPLKLEALEQSLKEIVRRHESLRTSFATVDGSPVQVIAEVGSVEVVVIDLRNSPEAERESEAMRLCLREARRPFDLTRGPLLGAFLLRLQKDEHIFLLTMHHIISDGWSLALLFEEMGALYDAFSTGKASPLAEPSLQYVDFAQWQREQMQGEILGRQLDYWREHLAGAPALLALPTDRPRPAAQSFRGARQALRLSKVVTKGLKALSSQQGATLFMTLLAAFETLLYRYAGQDDIVLGIPIANRSRAETESIVGFFANTLALRTDLSGNPSFNQLLGRVREVAMGAYAHQDLPFEKLVDVMQPERELSYAPLFQVVFSLQDAPRHSLKLSGLSSTPFEIESGTAKFDLVMNMWETGHGLAGSLEYNTDLFESSSITLMLGHFQTLLQSILADPEQSISELALLTDAERNRTLVEWNDTKVDYPKGACIHELFEAQAAKTPGNPAVVFEDQCLTYAELNNRANQLAGYLRNRSVGPESLVGIAIERSIEMVVGLLGILKAGAAYVPIDPSYPRQRLAFMLEDADVEVLLTERKMVETLPAHRSSVICLDSDWDAISRESEASIKADITPDSAAYMIYTSGSTGRPKGAINTHRGISNRLLWMQDAYRLTESDRVLQKTPFSFDVSVWEFFWPLITGARLIVACPGGHMDSAYLVNLIAEQKITVLHFVPSMLQIFLQEHGLEKCASLRHVICSGEALTYETERLFFAALDADLHNLYGPTEAAVDVTYWACNRESQSRAVPIGRPIANTQIYLLDKRMNPVMPLSPGELYIGGAGLARGYHNRPDLTAEKFIPDPFRNEPGARLYRTGDLARYLPGGEIEFLGRIDHQVKIRGFRIELGEIEAALRQMEEVSETAVVAREEESGERRLVAYVVPDQRPGFHERLFSQGDIDGDEPAAILVQSLRQRLRKLLPNYMVPSAFVILDELPLKPNGKLDFQALPAPDRSKVESESTYVTPRNPVEEALSEIWSQVLGLDRVGIHSNFFDLGGDSILSMQIVSRANQRSMSLTPKQIFQHQTIAELAAVAGTTAAVEAEQDMVIGTAPLTPIQHWFFEQNLPEPHHYNQAALLEARRTIDPLLLERAFERLLSQHDALRLCFEDGEPGWQQTNRGPGEGVPFSCVDLSGRSQAEQQAALEQEAARLQASLNLEKGQLVRVTLFHMGAQRHDRLLIVIHHLAVDGVSWRILLEDLEATYESFERGVAVNLPRKTTSFKQWAERLKQYGQSPALERELDYWLSYESTRISPLPVDNAGGANTIASSSTVSVSLSVEETRELLQEVPAAYRTEINDALLTALVRAFASWTGEAGLLIDLEGHGREEIIEGMDLSRTVGWFTSLFPVLLKVEKAAGPGDALKSMKEQLRAIPSKGIGYGVLKCLDDDGIGRKLRSLPHPEVSFNYLGQFDRLLSDSSIFKLTQEPSGPWRASQQSRAHLLGIDGVIRAGHLQFGWVYSREVHRRSTVETLANRFIEELRSIISHCQSSDAGGYTPSDFPDVALSEEKLEKVLEEIGMAFREAD